MHYGLLVVYKPRSGLFDKRLFEDCFSGAVLTRQDTQELPLICCLFAIVTCMHVYVEQQVAWLVAEIEPHDTNM